MYVPRNRSSRSPSPATGSAPATTATPARRPPQQGETSAGPSTAATAYAEQRTLGKSAANRLLTQLAEEGEPSSSKKRKRDDEPSPSRSAPPAKRSRPASYDIKKAREIPLAATLLVMESRGTPIDEISDEKLSHLRLSNQSVENSRGRLSRGRGNVKDDVDATNAYSHFSSITAQRIESEFHQLLLGAFVEELMTLADPHTGAGPLDSVEHKDQQRLANSIIQAAVAGYMEAGVCTHFGVTMMMEHLPKMQPGEKLDVFIGFPGLPNEHVWVRSHDIAKDAWGEGSAVPVKHARVRPDNSELYLSLDASVAPAVSALYHAVKKALDESSEIKEFVTKDLYDQDMAFQRMTRQERAAWGETIRDPKYVYNEDFRKAATDNIKGYPSHVLGKIQDRNPSKDLSAAAMTNKLDVGKEIKAMHIAERLGESRWGAVAAAPDIVDHAKSYGLPESAPGSGGRNAAPTRRGRG